MNEHDIPGFSSAQWQHENREYPDGSEELKCSACGWTHPVLAEWYVCAYCHLSFVGDCHDPKECKAELDEERRRLWWEGFRFWVLLGVVAGLFAYAVSLTLPG
jgi:hypothetical protein